MGVTGSGKTTIGEGLARRLGLPFYDADDFHPAANLAKLSRDIPLTDADRQPWLDSLSAGVREWSAHRGAVLACSALKHAFRSQLRRASGGGVRFIFLTGDHRVIASRIQHRSAQGEHTVKDFVKILDGQFRDLEPPTDAIQVDIEQTPEAIVNEILSQLS